MEAATRTAAMSQATPVRNGKETKVLLTTRERGNNLIGTELTELYILGTIFMAKMIGTPRITPEDSPLLPEDCCN